MKAKNDRNIAANIVKKIADKMADFSYGTASGWGMYQAKEPKKAKK